uniref:Uncharacterized protein n=1 Tax=Romanomermis culicivorax TaxID=13658 RepID=A0A915HJQ6_ROMCU
MLLNVGQKRCTPGGKVCRLADCSGRPTVPGSTYIKYLKLNSARWHSRPPATQSTIVNEFFQLTLVWTEDMQEST